MTKRCFGWRYRVSYAWLPGDRYDNILASLCEHFSHDSRGKLWDLTGVWRAASCWDARYYSRVKVHFLRQEDMVMFKLVYCLDPSQFSI